MRELAHVFVQRFIFNALLEHLARLMVGHIGFVKCLQGDTAGPGAGFHKYLRFGLRGIIDIFDVNINATHPHADHIRYGAGYIVLDFAADVPDIDLAI